MLIRKAPGIRSSEVTPRRLYLNRRQLLLGLPAAFAGAAAAAGRFGNAAHSPFSTTEKVTPFQVVTNYNNYYEFGTGKEQPATLARALKTSPWTVSVEGLVAKPRKYSIEEITSLAPLEERIYRHRCVEGWSIVVPWIGYSLNAILKQV